MIKRNCENCANVHCYRFTPKYELCKNGSLWQPYRNKRTKEREFRKQITKQIKEIKEKMTKEELDKEAEEFADSKKSFWRQGRTCIDSVKQAYIAGAEPREKRIEELEKENTELKEKNNNLVASSKTIISLSDEIETRTTEQLTKAKGLITRLSVCFSSYAENIFEIELVKEAEQFLKEVSE